MIQNYRLAHFDQLMKANSHQLEARTEFVLQMGKSVKSSKKYSSLPPTPLYCNRTESELTQIENIQISFRNAIAKLLQVYSLESTESVGDQDPTAVAPSKEERLSDEQLQPVELEACDQTKVQATYLHTSRSTSDFVASITGPSVPTSLIDERRNRGMCQ